MNADVRVMAHFPSCLTRAESDTTASHFRDHLAQHGFGLWAVELPGVAGFAGFVGLSVPKFDAHFTPCLEIGWRLAYPYWNRGYATEAARAAVEFGFRELVLDEIVSFTVRDNVASRRVMQKLGMSRNPGGGLRSPSATGRTPVASARALPTRPRRLETTLLASSFYKPRRAAPWSPLPLQQLNRALCVAI